MTTWKDGEYKAGNPLRAAGTAEHGAARNGLLSIAFH